MMTRHQQQSTTITLYQMLLFELTPLFIIYLLHIKTVEFVATALDVVPLEILHIFPQLLMDLNCINRLYHPRHLYLSLKIIESIKTLISYKSSYKQLLRDTGMLDQIVHVLEQVHELGEDDGKGSPALFIPGQDTETTAFCRDATCDIWLDLLGFMLSNSPSNEETFRDTNGE